jgi:hypothetical protein
MPVGPRHAAPLAALALCLAACGGKSEKNALRAYEASVEDLMAEDGKVSAQLTDLWKDMVTANAAAKDQTAFGREHALPFYDRFRQAAAKAPAEHANLRAVHADLLAYLDERIAYLRSFEALYEASNGEVMERLRKMESPWQASLQELGKGIEAAGGKIADADVQRALRDRVTFMAQLYEPFGQGRVPARDVEKALREVILPQLARIADRTKDQLTAEGAPGVLARWAAAETAFFQELASTLPAQEAVRKAKIDVQERWKVSGELRDRYLARLRTYRDSLR